VSKWLVQALPDAHRAASVAHSPCVVSSAFGPMLWRAVRRERRGLTCACCHGDGTARGQTQPATAPRPAGRGRAPKSLRASQRKRACRVGTGERPGSSTGATRPTEARGSCLETTDGGPCLPLPRQQRHAGRGPRQHARSTSETPSRPGRNQTSSRTRYERISGFCATEGGRLSRAPRADAEELVSRRDTHRRE
jgi:hypothetical protein